MIRRRYRRNAEEKLRDLERLAAAGDTAAALAAVRHRLRTGQADLQWLIGAGPESVKHLPLELAVDLYRTIADGLPMEVREFEEIGRTARTRATKDRWGWFPEHDDNLRCPRGHRDEEVFFDITDGGHNVHPELIDREGAWLSFDAEDLTGLTVAINCSKCDAHWPLSGRVGWANE